MAVFRLKKNNNYTCMSNYHLRDTTISLKAIGLLSKMLSLPDNWDYSFNGLVAICKENKSSIRSVINELKEHKYIEIIEERDDKGHYQYIYNVYEKPKTENQTTDNQKSDNVPQLNTNILNKEKLNIENNIKKVSKKEESFDDIINNLVSNDKIKNEVYEFIKMRKLIKKPLTNRALEMIIKKLYSLSDNEQEQIDILDQSIINNWQNIYPVRKDKQQPKEETLEEQAERLKRMVEAEENGLY